MRKFSILTLAVAFFVINFAYAIKLNPNGGYEISVAIDESVESKGQMYISAIEGIFTTLSSQLYRTTNGTFFVQNVNIIVPSTWAESTNPVKQDAVATIESFETSDIRVSNDYTVPYVENPNICGRPGEFIQFPTDFFSKKNNGDFGKAWKALLNQWARYRWGVWEEHGLPGDARFPYFHKETPKSQSWQATGCSDKEIVGKYVNQFGETDAEKCNNSGEEALSEECRFNPSPVGNTASSSLMHFHSLESVTDFCDEDTHIRTAPNKQNVFCNYKSVLKVMRETSDFKTVTNPETSGALPVVQFKTIGISKKPTLYVLLDKSQTNLPNLVRKLNTKLSQLFELTGINTVLGSIGTYPNPNAGNYVQEKITWATIASRKTEFIQTLLEEPSNSVNPDFGLAILEAVENIKRKNPPGGTILLIIKTGAGKGSFGTISYEEEVRRALLNSRIKLVTVELETSKIEPYVNLVSLTNTVGGVHKRVTASNIDDGIIERLIPEIETLLNDPVAPGGNSILIYKGQVTPSSDSRDRLRIFLRANLAHMNFSLTVPNNASVSLLLQEGSIDINSPRPEWDEIVDSHKRKVIYGSLIIKDSNIATGGLWNFRSECDENCEGVTGQLVVYGTPIPTLPLATEADVSVYTSAVNNIANLEETKDSDTPFSIFARAHLAGVPVANLTVQALIRVSGALDTVIIEMKDNGLGSPDIVQNDGIYSATFIPPSDGSYRITVRVLNDQLRDPPLTVKLIPIDQNKLGCASADCKPTSLTTYFETTVDLPAPVSVINTASFIPGKPSKINDLMISFEETLEIRLQFTSPELIGLAVSPPGVQYAFFLSKTMEALLGNLSDPNADIEIRYGEASPSGSRENFLVLNGLATDLVYVTVVTYNRAQKSEISNIQSVKVTPTGVTNPTNSPGPTVETTDPPNPTTRSPTNPTPTPTSSEEPTNAPPVSTESPSSQPPAQEEETPFFETTWGIVVIVAIVLVVLIAGGGIFYYCYRRREGKFNTEDELPEAPEPSGGNFRERSSSNAGAAGTP